MSRTAPPLTGIDRTNGARGAVYFLAQHDHCLMKIGYAADWRVRVRDIQCCNPFPLTVELVVSGTIKDEYAIRRALFGQGFRGEWVVLSEQTKQFVAEMAQTTMAPRAFADQRYKQILDDIHERTRRNCAAASAERAEMIRQFELDGVK
jgi:hypothetical protein